MSSLSRSLSPPLELEIQTNQILVAESPLGAIADLSLTTVAPSKDVHKSNLKHLDHFSHKHPLILYEEGDDDDDDDVRVGGQGIICSICRDWVWDGPIYSCSTECEFFLHKSCAEFPEAIRSVFHPEHLLLLSATLSVCICVICNEYENKSFSYECVDCEFCLHIKCALQYNMEDPQGHREHSLILLKPTLFTCDACGIDEKTKCVSFVCTTCQLQVHNNRKCSSSFPLTVKQIRHPHELSLTFLSPLYNCLLDDDHNYTCMICGRGMNGVICFYHCTDCRFIAHVMCAISENLRDEYDDEAFKELENDNQDQNTTTTTLAPGPIETTKEISHAHVGGGDGEDQKATDQLRHFSHPQHCLILSNDPKLNEFCDGCAMPISVPYYTCADQCNFLLHKQCFELPHKIQHPFHNHLLTLHEKAVASGVENTFGIFECRFCWVLCNGFTYACGKCKIFIDVGCGLFRNPLLHGGHKCALSLVDGGEEAKCSACGLDCFSKFVCKRCDFNLDHRCASLPNTISHDCPKPEWGIRPYNLTYDSVDDGSGEYYCDICEEPRIHNHWFYFCKNCDYSAHPQCLLAKDRIKFGKTYLSEYHPHLLTLVKEAKDKGMGHPPCATCGDPCKGVAFLFCTECNIYIHHRYLCCGSGWNNL